MPSSVSTINYVTGRSITNSATSKVSAAGKVSFFSLNTTDLILDVVGYYRSTPGAGYVPLTPSRVLDTRQPNAVFSGVVPARGVVQLPVSGSYSSVELVGVGGKV